MGMSGILPVEVVFRSSRPALRQDQPTPRFGCRDLPDLANGHQRPLLVGRAAGRVLHDRGDRVGASRRVDRHGGVDDGRGGTDLGEFHRASGGETDVPAPDNVVTKPERHIVSGTGVESQCPAATCHQIRTK